MRTTDELVRLVESLVEMKFFLDFEVEKAQGATEVFNIVVRCNNGSLRWKFLSKISLLCSVVWF